MGGDSVNRERVSTAAESSSEAQHVARTLRALELLAGAPRTPVELAALLDVVPRTARRLIERLVAEGYAVPFGEGRSYAASLKLVALAGGVIDRIDVVRIAFPFVTRLRNETQETSHLSVPVEHGVLHLLHETGERLVGVRPRFGEQVPYHATAVGKALLAYRPDEWERLRGLALESFTPFTIVEPAQLFVELAEIRERGYAVDDRENSLDLRCVAAPVFDYSRTAIAALGMSAPETRLSIEGAHEVSEVVKATAQALSEALGFDGSVPDVGDPEDNLATIIGRTG